MSIILRNIKTDTRTTLVWSGDGVMRNLTGNAVSHLTTIIFGTVEIRFTERTVTLTAGQDIVIPIKVPYDVITIGGPAIVHCIYPTGPAADSIKHLLSDTPVRYPEIPLERCIKRIG